MLIATDLDGTLVPRGSGTVTARTAAALRTADRAGIPVVFVTARPLRWMTDMWRHVGEHGLAIVSNGAITYDVHAGDVLTLDAIDPADGLALVAVIGERLPQATFAIECVDGLRRDPRYEDLIPAPSGSPRGPLADVWDAPAAKLLVRDPSVDDDVLRTTVAAAIGDEAVATWSVPGLVEISARGVTKATALMSLCAMLAVAARDVVAFGDMPNDIPMLAWAGTSYAMAGAHDSVLAVADHVAPPVEQDGVAQVLTSLLHNRRHDPDGYLDGRNA